MSFRSSCVSTRGTCQDLSSHAPEYELPGEDRPALRWLKRGPIERLRAPVLASDLRPVFEKIRKIPTPGSDKRFPAGSW
jgi:hypothetical protein